MRGDGARLAGPPRRAPAGVVAVVALVVAVVAGIGGGVATVSVQQADCRPVSVFAASGSTGDVVGAVTGPLAERAGERVGVVTVPPPAAGASYPVAQQDAVGALATRVTETAAACPDSRLMLIGYSEGAHVVGDLTSRIGTGQERGIPPDRVVAVGLFGDPARSPFTRVVPREVPGQGVLPPRAAGFGVLDARTIEVCAPGDPVCDSPAQPPFPSLEQALAAPPHASYDRLPVARSLTATQWAADSLGKLVDSVPEAPPSPAAPPPSPSAAAPTSSAPAPSSPAGVTASVTAPPTTTAPATTAPATTAPATTAPTTTATTTAPPTSGSAVPTSGRAASTSTTASTSTPKPSTTDAIFALTDGLAGFQEPHEGNVDNGEDPAPVASPNVPGREAIKLALPAGGERSELRPDEAAQDIRAGERLFFGWSAFVPRDFPVDADRFQVVWQLHDGGTNESPPVALEVQRGKLWLANVGELVQDLGPVEAGRNLAVQMEVEFARGGGSVSVWRDGRQVVDGFRPPRGTMIDDRDYLKTGLYRDGAGAPAAELFLNDLKVGDSLESVSGLAGASSPAAVGPQALLPWAVPPS